MFAPMTGGEKEILHAHLNSGWRKQAAVYPVLSEPWRETSVLLDDLHGAWEAARQASRAGAEKLQRQLVRHGLVSLQRGSDDREAHYVTTSRFLELFNLRSLEDLPQTQDLQRL